MGKKGIPDQGNPGAKLQIMSSSEHSSAFFEQQVRHSDLLARVKHRGEKQKMMLTCVILDRPSHADGEISIGFLVPVYHCSLSGMHACFLEPQSPQRKAQSLVGPLTIKRSKASYITVKVLADLWCSVVITFITIAAIYREVSSPMPHSPSLSLKTKILQEELEHFFTEEMVILGLICLTNEAKLFS